MKNTNRFDINHAFDKKNYARNNFMDSTRQANRKQSLRWHSDETKVLEKYGAFSTSYLNRYATDPSCVYA